MEYKIEIDNFGRKVYCNKPRRMIRFKRCGYENYSWALLPFFADFVIIGENADAMTLEASDGSLFHRCGPNCPTTIMKAHTFLSTQS